YHPGLLNLESRIARATGDALGRLGHKIGWWPDWTWLAGAVCTVVADLESGVLKGGADPRRPSYAVGLRCGFANRSSRWDLSPLEFCARKLRPKPTPPARSA